MGRHGRGISAVLDILRTPEGAEEARVMKTG